MSILFKKLELLKGKGNDPSLENPSPQTARQVYTFKKLILSPKGLLFILTAIISFGCISFYSLAFLKSMLDSSSQNAFVVQHQNTGSNPADDFPDPMDDLAQAPPGSEESLSTDGLEKNQQKARETFKVPQYFILKTQAASDISQNEDPDTPPENPAAIIPATQVLMAVKKNRETVEDPTASIYTIIKKKAPDPAPPVLQIPAIGPIHQKLLTGSDSQPSNPHEQNNLTPAKPAPDPEKQKTVQQEANRLAREQKTRRISVIAGLASDLERAIEAKNKTLTDALMAQLEASTDKSTSYYLKLKAYQLIREEKYDLARIWLNKVLKKDPADFEAGLNMAIIDIRQNARDTAKKRLIQLQERYPAHATINHLLDQL